MVEAGFFRWGSSGVRSSLSRVQLMKQIDFLEGKLNDKVSSNNCRAY